MTAKQRINEVIAGFMYMGQYGEDADRYETICQIVARSGSDSEQLDEPRFLVEFSDGYQTSADSSDLRPWYNT